MLSDLNNPAAQFAVGTAAAANGEIQLEGDCQLMAPKGLPCDYDLVSLKTFFSASERFKGELSADLSILSTVVVVVCLRRVPGYFP